MEELIYCNYCKTNTQQMDETTGTRCQKCLNQNPFFNCSPKEYSEYLKDLCIINDINDHKGLLKYYDEQKKRIGRFVSDTENQMGNAVSETKNILKSEMNVMEYSKMTTEQMAEELCEVIRDGAASTSTVMHMIDEWKKDLQHHKDTTVGLWATEVNVDWMNNPKYDEVYQQLKDEGYSTGSEDDTDKLMEELKRRLSAPSFSLQQALDIWDAAIHWHYQEEYGSVPTQAPDKKQYFKEQFKIDLP